MERVLGYDCDGNELYQFDIVRAIFYSDIDFSKTTNVDPRQYCVVVGEDGKAYLFSVLDHWEKVAINRYEGRGDYDKIPLKILPIEDAHEYELAHDCDDNRFTYPFNKQELMDEFYVEHKKQRRSKSKYNFKADVRLFMIFDILGDTERTGPHLWQIDRERLEDVKNHVFDLTLIARILQKYLPDGLDFNKINDYILCHDLPEAITGDITAFEGVPRDEIKRVTNLAIDYLDETFGDTLDVGQILRNYEDRIDLEAKVVNMIDKVHSSTTFMKYESEQHVDMDDPRIISTLRGHPFVVEKIAEGKDLADIFYEFHMKSVNISDEECARYGISREYADEIVAAIRGFADEMYTEKVNGTLLDASKSFPQKAMIYNRRNTGSGEFKK